MGATRTMEGATLLVRLATLHFISVWKISTPAHQDHLGSELTLAEAGLGMLGLPLLLHAPPTQFPWPSLPLRDKYLNLTTLLVGSDGTPGP